MGCSRPGGRSQRRIRRAVAQARARAAAPAAREEHARRSADRHVGELSPARAASAPVAAARADPRRPPAIGGSALSARMLGMVEASDSFTGRPADAQRAARVVVESRVRGVLLHGAHDEGDAVAADDHLANGLVGEGELPQQAARRALQVGGARVALHTVENDLAASASPDQLGVGVAIRGEDVLQANHRLLHQDGLHRVQPDRLEQHQRHHARAVLAARLGALAHLEYLELLRVLAQTILGILELVGELLLEVAVLRRIRAQLAKLRKQAVQALDLGLRVAQFVLALLDLLLRITS